MSLISGYYKAFRLKIKDLLFPGSDFLLRKRLKLVKKYLRPGPVKTLDAGCGNGAFCFLCYRLGNSVLGTDIDSGNIKRCIEYRNYKGIPDAKVRFMQLDMHNLLELNEAFDQILCFETLEHIVKDKYILGIFAGLLRPGGVLHLGVPNFNCPDYYGERVSSQAGAGHVRKGYTYSLLEDIFRSLNLKTIEKSSYGGVFTRRVTALSRMVDSPLKILPCPLRQGISALFFLIANPFTFLDNFFKAECMSIYIMAKKA